MKGIIADADLIGVVRVLIRVIEQSIFAPTWAAMSLRVVDFSELGLAKDTADRLVWEKCQEQGLILITGNRNEDGPDSLQATIRNSNLGTSLPVLAIGSVQRVMRDRMFAERVAIDMLEYLSRLRDDPDSLAGTGRLYVPISASNP